MTRSIWAAVIISCAGILSGVPAAAQASAPKEARSLAFKDVIAPNQAATGLEVYWSPPSFLGDGDSDGFPESLAILNAYDPNNGMQVSMIGVAQAARFLTSLHEPGSFNFGGGWQYNGSVAISSPAGGEVSGTGSQWPTFYDYFFPYSGAPPRGPISTPPGSYDNMCLMIAGDITRDGWDDVFAYGINTSGVGLLAGLVDGNTLQQVWSVSDLGTPAYSPFPVWAYRPEGPPDVDGDGIADLILGYNLVGTTAPPWQEFLIRAYSGANGAFLWERILTHSLYASFVMLASTGSDLDGDGISDLAVLLPHNIWHNASGYYWEPGRLMALSGADGSELWSVHSMSVDPHWPGLPDPNDYYQPAGPIAMDGDVDGDGIDDVVFSVTRRLPPNHQLGRPLFLATYSGESGTFLGLQGLPSDALPWTRDPVARPIQRGFYPLGDTDADGWQDVGTLIDYPSMDLDGQDPVPRGLGILSRPSLVIDEEAAPGDTLLYRLHLPAAGGCDYTLLASTTFSYRQGLWLGDWNTQLGPSRLLTATMARQPFRGTLGPSGKAGGVIQVPPRPVLSGLTIYWRAIVTDPALPNAVRTQSNLARTEMR